MKSGIRVGVESHQTREGAFSGFWMPVLNSDKVWGGQGEREL